MSAYMFYAEKILSQRTRLNFWIIEWRSILRKAICYGKMTSASRDSSGPCGGMAEGLKAHVLKTCLGHTNVGSNPTPSAIGCRLTSWNFQTILGRCQSGRMGPPAKRLLGRNPQSQVRILSSPPEPRTRPLGARFRVRVNCLLRSGPRSMLKADSRKLTAENTDDTESESPAALPLGEW